MRQAFVAFLFMALPCSFAWGALVAPGGGFTLHPLDLPDNYAPAGTEIASASFPYTLTFPPNSFDPEITGTMTARVLRDSDDTLTFVYEFSDVGPEIFDVEAQGFAGFETDLVARSGNASQVLQRSGDGDTVETSTLGEDVGLTGTTGLLVVDTDALAFDSGGHVLFSSGTFDPDAFSSAIDSEEFSGVFQPVAIPLPPAVVPAGVVILAVMARRFIFPKAG